MVIKSQNQDPNTINEINRLLGACGEEIKKSLESIDAVCSLQKAIFATVLPALDELAVLHMLLTATIPALSLYRKHLQLHGSGLVDISLMPENQQPRITATCINCNHTLGYFSLLEPMDTGQALVRPMDLTANNLDTILADWWNQNKFQCEKCDAIMPSLENELNERGLTKYEIH